MADLPGIISVANDEQTDDAVETVQYLVDSYISNPRTIVLAVVQASNDIANQGIIQKSRRFDKRGQHTVGIITKPDLINIGTAKQITKLQLGFFLVKIPTPSELAHGVTLNKRQRNEERYFQSSPWKEQTLDRERVGIRSLRTYLQRLIDQHIERELPKVREEIREMIQLVEQDLATLGDDRPTFAHLRMFLPRMAMQFHSLTTSALNGTYYEADGTFFGEIDDKSRSRRLRAVVHQLNSSFAEYMRQNGQKRKIRRSQSSDDSSDSEEEPEEGQLLVTEAEMKSWVKEVKWRSDCSLG